MTAPFRPALADRLAAWVVWVLLAVAVIVLGAALIVWSLAGWIVAVFAAGAASGSGLMWMHGQGELMDARDRVARVEVPDVRSETSMDAAYLAGGLSPERRGEMR